MAGIKSLAKDTAVYGLSSILGRFLNWCLVPLYTIMFPAAEYGIVTYIYSFTALALIILTYGMETGFFRFTAHERYPDPMEVYSTSLISLASSSLLFIALLFAFLAPVSRAMGCAAHPDYVWMMGVAVALDAFTAIPFSYLRYRKKAMRFAALRLVNIALNIGLNIFFILICPWLWRQAPGWIAWFYDPDFGIGYIFLTNLVTSAVNVLLLLPELRGFPWRFNGRLLREMLAYSAPLLVLGIAGVMNQSIDKIIFPSLCPDPADAMHQLGIYGANYKIAIVMVMFIQAYRFAYEPFIFARGREAGSEEARMQSYRDAMKWFVIASMAIFLIVMFYIDIVKHFIAPSYYSGLRVVPIIMIAEFFFGVFFNLSLWYKLTDKTQWGMWLSLLGLVVTIGLNVILVPRMGYMGCAIAALGCYATMMLTSYWAGRTHYPIGYDIPRMCLYFLLAMLLWIVGVIIGSEAHPILTMLARTPLLLVYLLVVMRAEHLSLSSLRALIPRRR